MFFPVVSGDVPRVNGQLAVSRAFGDKSLKSHLRSDPYVQDKTIDLSTDLLILASDGLWKVILRLHISIYFVYSSILPFTWISYEVKPAISC